MPDQDWRQNLMARHPDMFGMTLDDPGEPSGYPHVGDGWRQIVETAISRVVAALARAPGSRVTVNQIKEKFGGIRIYFATRDVPQAVQSQITAAVELAEARSFCTCEACGAPGRLFNNGGIYLTRCDAHASGRPVQVRPGHENLHVKYVIEGGTGRFVGRRYDRKRDEFVEVPLPPDFRKKGR